MAKHASPGARARRLQGDIDVDVVLGARRLDDDGGYVLAFTGLLLIPLTFFVALAIDLGAWYAQGSRLQRAADAAAMAGVVWMPDTGRASAAAQAAAEANGYNHGTGGITVSVSPGSQETDYRATVSAPAPRFFSQVLGMQAFSITRTATARFNNPIPLGSPANQLGNDVNIGNDSSPECANFQPAANCGVSPLLWTALNGPFAGTASGDPYSVKCVGNGDNLYVGNATTCNRSTGNGAQNPLYKPDGYSFAIDVTAADVGRPLTLWIYDALQSPRSNSDCSGLSAINCQTGDIVYNAPAPLEVAVYPNDGYDLAVTYPADNAPLLGTAPPQGAPNNSCRLYVAPNGAAATYENRWVRACQFTPDKVGIYPFRVRSSGGLRPITNYSGHNVADVGDGINAFAMKVTYSNGAKPTTRLYALDNLSIFTNTPGSTARFYLADITQAHRGKKLQLDLFDPGDGTGSQSYTMQVLGPPAGSPATIPTGGTPYSCNYNATRSATIGPPVPDTSSTCTITTKTSSTSRYQDGWLRVEISIPGTYTCSVDCWWTIRYNFGSGGSPYDRTVWSLNVVGDPVHLIQ